MKDMSYRDKMVILVISIIVIMAVGFFALIKPTYNKMVEDTSIYESTKTEWEGIKAKLDAIPGLKETITSAYNDAKKDAAVLENTAFGDLDKDYEIKKVNYGLDQYLHQVIDDNNLKVSSFAIGDTGSTGISYFYYEPDAVTYALLESGDLNGKYATDLTKLMEKSSVISTRETADVIGNNVTLSVEGKREDLMNFLDAMKEDNNAIYITTLDITDYQFSGGATREQTDAEGNVTTVVDPNAEGTSALSIDMLFYNAKELDKPDLGD